MKPSPWDRLPEESPRAYAAFLVYRDLGPDRSLNKAWRHQKGNERVTAPGRVRHWSTTYCWVERSCAWDQHLRCQRENAERKANAQLGLQRANHQLESFSSKAALADSLLKAAHVELASLRFTPQRVVAMVRAAYLAESLASAG